MIITEANGKRAEQLEDRIALLSAADRATAGVTLRDCRK